MSSAAYSNCPRRIPGRCWSVMTFPSRTPAEVNVKSLRSPVLRPPWKNAPTSQGLVASIAFAGASIAGCAVCAKALKPDAASAAPKKPQSHKVLIFIRTFDSPQKKGRQCRRPRSCWREGLTGDLFQLLRVHVEIGIYVLYVVVVFEGLQQADHLRRYRAFQPRI